jgi:hypothetical protein
MTNIRRTCIRAAKFTSILAVITCLQTTLFPPTVAAESIEELRGMKPMSTAELASSTGGFIMPNGLNVNVGVMVNSMVQSALGNLSVSSVFSTDAPHAQNQVSDNGVIQTTEGDVSVALQGNGGVTHIRHDHDGLSALITNTANDVDIHQSRTVTISVSNYYSTMNPGLAGKLIALRITAMNTHPWKFH